MGRLKQVAPRIGVLRSRVPRAFEAGQENASARKVEAPWRAWYNSARWKALRLRIFLRDDFTCQMKGCGRIEGNTSLLVCDHKRPHHGNERLFWDEANLQTLCKPCHDSEKQREEQATIHTRGVWD